MVNVILELILDWYFYSNENIEYSLVNEKPSKTPFYEMTVQTVLLFVHF